MNLNNDFHDFILYNKMYEDENKSILSVLYNGKTILPIVEQGRYFDTTDFFNEKKVAVVGKDILNMDCIIEKDNNVYFLFHNDIFEVIGIMDYGQDISMNKTVFINMDSVIDKLNSIFCIDGNKNKVKNIVNNLIDNHFIRLLPFQKSILNKVIDLNTQSLILLNASLIITYLVIILILSAYFYYSQDELYVYRVLGFSFFQILKLLLFKISYIVIRVVFLFALSMIVISNLFIYEEKAFSIYMVFLNIGIFIFIIYIFTCIFLILNWNRELRK